MAGFFIRETKIMDCIYFKIITNFYKTHKISILLFLILLFSLITKSWRLYYPDEYVFDEVYVRFTAEEIAKNNPETWVWDYPSPKGFAYGWSHPQFGKSIMAGFIKLFGQNSLSSRLAPMIAGVLISILVFLISKFLFPKNPNIWLLAAFLTSLDGLILVLSRIGLADTMLTLFLLNAFYFLLKSNYKLSALFWGMAVSTKWSAVYFLPLLMIITIVDQKWQKNTHQLIKNIFKIFTIMGIYVGIGPIIQVTKNLANIVYESVSTNNDQLIKSSINPKLLWSFLLDYKLFFLIGTLFILWYIYVSSKLQKKYNIFKIIFNAVTSYFGIGTFVYLTSYFPLFYIYGVDKFIDLQNQMYWYHTGLDATHPYQSQAFSWPLDIRPVWLWVDYGKETVANIYALGNPIIFWAGTISIFFVIGYYYISRKKQIFYLLTAYFAFWLPWTFSPRIMFLYHYLPSVPYLCIILSFTLNTTSSLAKITKYLPLLFILMTIATFIFFYPYWTGIPVHTDQVNRFIWLKSWK